MEISEIIEHIDISDFEISGKFEDGKFIKIHEGEPKKPGARASVAVDNNKIIWHTHPTVSKYYPSVEDICKILKGHPGQEIEYSILFTVYGVWLFSNPIKTRDVDDRLKAIIDNECNKQFYRASGSGRTYNTDAIQLYIECLKAGINNFGANYNFDIMFYPSLDLEPFLQFLKGLSSRKGGKKHRKPKSKRHRKYTSTRKYKKTKKRTK
jgi:hypothetical protein